MIPYSRSKLSTFYIPYPRLNCLKTIPLTAAHIRIAYVWECPPPPPPPPPGFPLTERLEHWLWYLVFETWVYAIF